MRVTARLLLLLYVFMALNPSHVGWRRSPPPSYTTFTFSRWEHNTVSVFIRSEAGWILWVHCCLWSVSSQRLGTEEREGLCWVSSWRSLLQALTKLCTHPLTHSPTYPPTHSVICLPSIIYLFIHSLITYTDVAVVFDITFSTFLASLSPPPNSSFQHLNCTFGYLICFSLHG